FHGYIKTLVEGKPVDPFDFRLMPPHQGDLSFVETAKQASYQKYGRDRDEIQAEIDAKYDKKNPAQSPAAQNKPKPTPPSKPLPPPSEDDSPLQSLKHL